jgi:hypothetical protein
LTRRANQVHIDTIADILEPAPETAAGFFISLENRLKQFQFVETVSSNFLQFVHHSKTFDMSGKSPA